MEGMEGVIALFVSIVFFFCIAFIFGLFFYFRHRSKRDFQATVRAAIDRGQELTPEILDQLGHPASPAKSKNISAIGNHSSRSGKTCPAPGRAGLH